MRTRPALRHVFSILYGTLDLVTSFDSICAWRPWGLDANFRPDFREQDGGWFHVDQSPDNTGFACVQGVVDLMGSKAASGGGNTLVPRSHHHFGRWRREYSARVDELFAECDYFEIPPGDKCIGRAIVPLVEPGDLLLWDSRYVLFAFNCSPSTNTGL